MSIRSATYELLSGIETAVYAIAAPQETTGTYITYMLRREPIRSQDGIAGYDTTLTLNIYAQELDDAVTMAATMFAGLEDTSGTYDSQALEVLSLIHI